MKTYNVEIKKTIKLGKEDVIDILSACFNGGCGYWAMLDNTDISWKIAKNTLKENGETCITMEDIMAWILCNDRSIFLEDTEEDERYSFDMDDFLRGIRMCIEEGEWDGEDICDIDGAVGDAIIQYAVFDELVYG